MNFFGTLATFLPSSSASSAFANVSPVIASTFGVDASQGSAAGGCRGMGTRGRDTQPSPNTTMPWMHSLSAEWCQKVGDWPAAARERTAMMPMRTMVVMMMLMMT